MRGILMKNPQRITKYIANVYIKYMNSILCLFAIHQQMR